MDAREAVFIQPSQCAGHLGGSSRIWKTLKPKMESMPPLAWGFRKHLEAAGLQTSSAGTCPLGMKWRILSKTFSWLSVFWGEKENSFCSTMHMSKFRWDTVHFPKRVYHLKMKHQTLNIQFLRDLTQRSIQGVCPLKESEHGRVLQAYGTGAQILLPFKARRPSDTRYRIITVKGQKP